MCSQLECAVRTPLCRRIPKIFHQIFLRGEAYYLQMCANLDAAQMAFTRESCLMFHPTWEHVFW